MSLHKIPLTPTERDGLTKHGLPVDAPSQLSDTFRLGMAWAKNATQQKPFVWWSDAPYVVWNSVHEGKHLSQDQRDEYLSCVEISGAIPLYLAPTTAESGANLPSNFHEVANAAKDALDIAQSILEASRSSHHAQVLDAYVKLRALLETIDASDASESVTLKQQKNARRYEWLRHGDNDEEIIQRGEIDIDLVYLPRNEKLDEMIDACIARDEKGSK